MLHRAPGTPQAANSQPLPCPLPSSIRCRVEFSCCSLLPARILTNKSSKSFRMLIHDHSPLYTHRPFFSLKLAHNDFLSENSFPINYSSLRTPPLKYQNIEMDTFVAPLYVVNGLGLGLITLQNQGGRELLLYIHNHMAGPDVM